MTIRQIADMFGVAPSTVSVVLNDRPGVRKEMREKITDALIENGYKIKKSESESKGSILFVYYKSTDYLAARKDNTLSTYLMGIEQTCTENHYSFSLTNASSETLDQVLASAQKEHKGVVILGTEYYENPSASFFNSNIPIVMLDAYFPECCLNTINMDNSYGVYEALTYLSEHRHRKIGYLKSRLEFGCLRDRANSIYDSMNTLSLGEPFCVIPVSQEAIQIQQEIQQYIDSGAEIPTAFIADNDIIAVSAMQTFQDNGFRIPDDISFIGFDDSDICTIIRPNLTTVRANLKEMARQSVLRLISLIESPPTGFIRIEVGTTLIKRHSVTDAKY
ncbi:MAG: LacI family DNA-binding transcriptional regulator [Eubacterium sp.]|nr:LacI family DNA-binding transcriptional regulator [Eubacterium sp.]